MLVAAVVSPTLARHRRCLALRWTTLLALLGISSAQDRATSWLDVCTAEDFATYRAELCPNTFSVSTLAFNPLYPNANSYMTLILQPSEDLPGSVQRMQYIDLDLPGFLPVGAINPVNAMKRDLTVTAANTVPIGVDPALSYNTPEAPVFQSPAEYDLRTRLLRLVVVIGKTLLANRDAEVTICCVQLPSSSAQDSPIYRIEGPTSLQGVIMVRNEPIKSTPFIDPGLQWEFLRVAFDPPVSRSLTIIDLTVRPANLIRDQARIILHMPSIVRSNNQSGIVNFNTAKSLDGSDWMYFDSNALWDKATSKLTFFLRSGRSLSPGKQVTLSTNAGEFRLPVELEADSSKLTVESRSFDNIDEVIRATPVMQSSAVPHVREFTMSQLFYLNNVPYAKSNVKIMFSTNRPLFSGSSVYLRLAGFMSESVEVPLKGNTRYHFQDYTAKFDLPANEIRLIVIKTAYTDETPLVVEMVDLILPPALYENDPSLLIWNSDPGAPRQSIQNSSIVGAGYKIFERSAMAFDPAEPRMPANISFTFQPSIVFYQGDKIIVHMYGFRCQYSQIPLLGVDAFRIHGMAAVWDAVNTQLTFTVAQNEIITNTAPFKVSIGRDSNFRLPDKLSENDGILRIEGQGAYIIREPMKKIPKIGEDKFVIESRVEFEPFTTEVNSVARISFSLVLNTDVLPNSTIYIKLGGLERDPPGTPLGVHAALRSGTIRLSGANGPLFVGEVGYWNQDDVQLTVKMISTVQIYSGERVQFFIERDEYFRLPYSAYPSDPSFRLAIPEAGIPERPFNFSTRVSQEGKLFIVSEIFYGARGSVAYPNTVVEFNFRFRPNVNLPGGTTVRLMLPGFTNPYTQVPIGTQAVPQLNVQDLSEYVKFGVWNAVAETFDIAVPRGRKIYRQLVTVLRVMEAGGFRLPTTALDPNDARLTIQAMGNVIIREEQIKTSPRVVERSFMVSKYTYSPPQNDSIFQLKIRLQPTVNITDKNDIILYLPKFVNTLAKLNIHIMGEDRFRIENSMGYWNETTAQLRMSVPSRQVIPAFTMMDLRIEESQGFELPSTLDANDTTLQIESVNNIQREPIKQSQMVGNGPATGHLFCMYQYEVGTRTSVPKCDSALDCQPPLTDPCSPTELTRCGCVSRVDEVFDFKIRGFNLQQEDKIHFVPMTHPCEATNLGPYILNPFHAPTSQVVNEDRNELTYTGISSIQTGMFRVCAVHVDRIVDVGRVTVRPSCAVPLVLVDGACVQHCPRTKIPIAGECKRDVEALMASDEQAYLINVTMTDPYAVPGTNTPGIAERLTSDPEQRYFIYRYVYELAKILNADPTRIQVASLSNNTRQQGSVIVNTVFKVVGTWADIKATNERSPFGLISLLNSLQQDTSSQLYQSTFFKYIDRNPFGRPRPVRECEDAKFRVFCPYTGGIMNTLESLGIFILGVLTVPVIVALFCFAVWKIDRDKSDGIDEDILEKIKRDPSQVELKLRIEYAKSWLEGRFMGEEWQRARKPIENII